LARGFGWSIAVLLGVALVLIPGLLGLAAVRRAARDEAETGRRR
jgi:hypothetical protein